MFILFYSVDQMTDQNINVLKQKKKEKTKQNNVKGDIHKILFVFPRIHYLRIINITLIRF